ncbi:unnamed protein product [Heligmosomoides polygyrus]|uniref:Lipoprotein n=1 Tax=Heligmosomoides polygyrus TaxID=6339 RepID=A0A183FTG4_HELPZ|nr:unnamed protein product [Heligmosomoides polygyrus]
MKNDRITLSAGVFIDSPGHRVDRSSVEPRTLNGQQDSGFRQVATVVPHVSPLPATVSPTARRPSQYQPSADNKPPGHADDHRRRE